MLNIKLGVWGKLEWMTSLSMMAKIKPSMYPHKFKVKSQIHNLNKRDSNVKSMLYLHATVCPQGTSLSNFKCNTFTFDPFIIVCLLVVDCFQWFRSERECPAVEKFFHSRFIIVKSKLILIRNLFWKSALE